MTRSRIISELAPCDAGPVIRLFTDPEVRKFLGGPLTPPEAEARAGRLVSEACRGSVWAIRDPGDENREAIGLVWLGEYRDGVDLELSYALLPEWQGRGLAYRACLEVLSIAFDTRAVNRVVAETQSANARSIALLERLGMKLERRLERFGAEQSIYVMDRIPERSGGIGQDGPNR